MRWEDDDIKRAEGKEDKQEGFRQTYKLLHLKRFNKDSQSAYFDEMFFPSGFCWLLSSPIDKVLLLLFKSVFYFNLNLSYQKFDSVFFIHMVKL